MIDPRQYTHKLALITGLAIKGELSADDPDYKQLKSIDDEKLQKLLRCVVDPLLEKSRSS